MLQQQVDIKPPTKPNGRWPRGTWLQRRLAELRVQEAQQAAQEGQAEGSAKQ